MTITADQDEKMLQDDIARFEPELSSLVKVPLSQGQWDTR
ncbi:glycoside hydrolase family protein [Pseudomonas gingeri]|nr:hypothetical protein [Pseudomonas gingeri]